MVAGDKELRVDQFLAIRLRVDGGGIRGLLRAEIIDRQGFYGIDALGYRLESVEEAPNG